MKNLITLIFLISSLYSFAQEKTREIHSEGYTFQITTTTHKALDESWATDKLEYLSGENKEILEFPDDCWNCKLNILFLRIKGGKEDRQDQSKTLFVTYDTNEGLAKAIFVFRENRWKYVGKKSPKNKPGSIFK